MARTGATTRTASSTRTGAAARTSISPFRVPIDILDLGVTHLWDWRTGFTGANKNNVQASIGGPGVSGFNVNLATIYTTGEYEVLLDGVNDFFRSGDLKIASSAMTAFTMFGWYKMTATNTGGMQLLSQYKQISTQRAWSLRYIGSSDATYPNSWRVFLSRDGQNATQYTVTTNAEYVTDLAWHFFIYTYTPTTDVIYIDGTAVAKTVTQNAIPTSIHVPQQSIDIGMLTPGGGGSSAFWNGRIGLCGLSTTTALSSTKVTDLYNLTNKLGTYV